MSEIIITVNSLHVNNKDFQLEVSATVNESDNSLDNAVASTINGIIKQALSQASSQEELAGVIKANITSTRGQQTPANVH
ncbi:hypothetical protein [Moritella viscosa]|uniref:Dyp-type peroxidase family n=1 Tax=Moritella viscosa TaxID=80854 RepID=A0ABY1H8M4_9GAMM|nr:hypothetical protein [Moritella viscosa]CED61157.1 putative uncharacterized phage gene [Moritella viscosa]SGY85172.1 Dyp-type peroxidase family [Moritella viscosa]SGY87417.1 Dyp-type peroxidase family [Moritella viscosa]SHN99513.1 Dyp-type peroxidase family [Moritella viscosa]SHO20126.1 Dyp-type peroxidase family [Moritella viscosa]